MMKCENRVALVTGAGSGIGRGLAAALAARGCHLVLADIDEARLAETARLVASNRVRVSRHRLDVADRAAVAALPAQIAEIHGGLDLLFNNAGVAVGGSFAQVSEADFEWLFEINFWGVVRVTRAFLPMLMASDDARIVNLSSVFGLIAPPGQAAYAASKFAVRGFTQALRHELAETRIGVTVVHPGGVATSVADNARMPAGASADQVAEGRTAMKRLLRMPPARAAEIIVKAVERRRARVLVGNDARMASWIERLLPVSYWKLVARMT